MEISDEISVYDDVLIKNCAIDALQATAKLFLVVLNEPIEVIEN